MPGQISHVDGIKFPATQVQSIDPNTLDDYEEGTWEAALACGTSGTITLVATDNLMSYTKVGRAVTLCGLVVVDSVSSPVGALTMTGLPFTSMAGAENNARTVVAIRGNGLEATGATSMVGLIVGGSNVITIQHFAAGVCGDAAADIKAGSSVMINVTYFTN